MILNIYDFTYLITNIFGTYIIYKFMETFFDRSEVNKKLEFFSYFIYFIVTSVIYLTINIPIVNLLFNLTLLFLLTFNYESSAKNRIISTIFIYLTLISIESIIVLLSGHLYKSAFSINTRYSSIIGMISIEIISYIAVLVIGNYNDIKKGVNIPNIYWLSIFFIPLGSLYIMIVLLKEPNFNTYAVIASITILLTINIVAFYLYDVLSKLFEDRMEKIMLKEQNKYYKKQLEIMDNNAENTRALRHDLKNHLAIVRGYMQIDEIKKAYEYIDKINQDIDGKEKISHSGNMDIDSILNYKLYEANQKDISVSLEVKVPVDMGISSFDIVVILGNLLDNAIEAASKVEDQRKIDIIIRYTKDTLFIHIKNTFNGYVFYEKNKIITSKEDRKNHGIGLNNIENILKKYNGVMEIDHNDNEFAVDIMMYIN